MLGLGMIGVGACVLLVLFVTRNADAATDSFVGWTVWQYVMTAVPFALITGGIGQIVSQLGTVRARRTRRRYQAKVERETTLWSDRDFEDPPISSREKGLYVVLVVGVVVMTLGMSCFATGAVPFNGLYNDQDHQLSNLPGWLHSLALGLIVLMWPLGAFLLGKGFPTSILDTDMKYVPAILWGFLFWPIYFLPALT